VHNERPKIDSWGRRCYSLRKWFIRPCRDMAMVALLLLSLVEEPLWCQQRGGCPDASLYPRYEDLCSNFTSIYISLSKGLDGSGAPPSRMFVSFLSPGADMACQLLLLLVLWVDLMFLVGALRLASFGHEWKRYVITRPWSVGSLDDKARCSCGVCRVYVVMALLSLATVLAGAGRSITAVVLAPYVRLALFIAFSHSTR
jgi:hypothetical protein